MNWLELIGLLAIASVSTQVSRSLWYYWRTGTTRDKALAKRLKALEEERLRYVNKRCKELEQRIEEQKREAAEAEEALNKLIDKFQ